MEEVKEKSIIIYYVNSQLLVDNLHVFSRFYLEHFLVRTTKRFDSEEEERHDALFKISFNRQDYGFQKRVA